MSKLHFIMVLALALWAVGTAAAQEVNSVDFNGIGFDYPASVAVSVQVTTVAADPLDLGIPAHTRIDLLPIAGDTSSTPPVTSVFVFQTADFGDYAAFAAELAALQSLLRDRPDLARYTDPAADLTLPRLPTAFAAQALRAQAAYVDNGVVGGIRYLTSYTQDPIAPITADRVEYTFQGISADGAHYIALVSRVFTSALPTQAPAGIEQDYPAYLAQTVAALNQLGSANFTPSLDLLDSIALSLRIDGVSAPETRPPLEATPSLGALGGTWTLLSYGDPAAPTTPLPNTTITLTVNELGVNGSSGCNTYFGGYAFVEDTISFAALGATRRACEPAIMDQESAYFRALGSAQTYAIDGDTLTITYADGVLTYQRAADSAAG